MPPHPGPLLLGGGEGEISATRPQAKTETKGKAVANYDSAGVTYDSGVTYDAGVLPQPSIHMPKVKVKLNLKDKSDSELLGFAQQHQTAMTGNTNFTTPLPAAAAFTAALTPFSTALGNFNTAQAAAKQATTVKDTARQVLEDVLTARGSYVELTAAGNPAIVESAGFSVKASKTSVTPPGTVMNLFITAGDNAGALDLQWDPTSTATRYEVQLCAVMDFASGVINLPSVQKSKAVATGLTTGTRMWARVRAGNSAGMGAWSDVATKIVP